VARSVRVGNVTGFEDFAGRAFFLLFVAPPGYFPRRVFYLTGDIHRPAAWLTVILSDSPFILRILSGLNLTSIL
jgi:hypothetical protein